MKLYIMRTRMFKQLWVNGELLKATILKVKRKILPKIKSIKYL